MAIVLAAGVVRADLTLPPIPEDENFVQDLAAMLPNEAEARLGTMQQEAFEKNQTPIVVVTIESMAEYGGANYSIERFAAEWFNHWQIGTRGEAGELLNRGILLLVSKGDREARIELGADWGRKWDKHCARIMDSRIVARFKRGDFAEGIVAGVEALQEMAALGPEADPPGALGEFMSDSMKEKPLATSPLPKWGIGLMLLAGVAMIVLSFFLPQHRKWLLIGGFGLIGVALIFWVIAAIAAIFMRSKYGGSSSGGGGFSGAGFGSGGFSGGGGASGSW